MKPLMPLPRPERRRFLEQAATIIAASATTKGAIAATPAITRGDSSCGGVHAPMREVADKVAFITGGSSGIGLGIARAFLEAKMKVVISYRTKSHLDEALRQLAAGGERVRAVEVDVTDRAGMERAAEETVRLFWKVHVLVNNAGVAVPSSLIETTCDDWDWMVNVNLNGVFNGVRAFLPKIRSHSEGGHVVTTSSVLGLFATRGLGAYSASKFGAVGLMESLHADLADDSIGVSVYCPGPVIPNIMNASRNRPRALGETSFKPSPQMMKEENDARNELRMQTTVLEAGRRVLDGVRKNSLYILTHPEYERTMHDRNEALMASVPRDSDASGMRQSDLGPTIDPSIFLR